MTANKLSRAPAGALFFFLALIAMPCRLPAGSTDVETIRKAFISQHIDVTRLKILSVEGIVILRGTVENVEALNVLTPTVKTLGFKRVANLVKIVSAPDDAALRRAVERELSFTRALDGCQFSVGASRGVVTLCGTVKSELQIDAAVAAARNVRGVRRVQTQLTNI